MLLVLGMVTPSAGWCVLVLPSASVVLLVLLVLPPASLVLVLMVLLLVLVQAVRPAYERAGLRKW